MVPINKPRREFQHQIRCSSTETETGTVPQLKVSWTYVQTITFGRPYDPGNHGIRIEINTQEDPTGATANSYSISIIYPTLWDGIGTLTLTGATFEAIVTSLLHWFDDLNLELIVDAECNWTLTSHNGFKWYIDGVLQLTVPPFTQSGTGFDKRYNKCKETASGAPLLLSIPANCPACATTFAGQNTKNHRVTAEVSDSGYRYKVAGVWVADLIHLEFPAPTDIGCACPRALPFVTADHSFNVGFTVTYFDRITKTFTGTEACPFPPPPTRDKWDVDQEWLFETVEVSIVAKTAGINETERYTSAQCNLDAAVETDVTTTDALTTCEMKVSNIYSVGHSECAGVCGVPD
jgi:hypothetical protein